jgi:cobalt/nickel transport system permease protein
VSAALVLVAGTGFHQVCVGLARLGVPPVFTTQLMFLYRYAHVLLGEAARMSLARELRAGRGGALPLAVYASLLGHLLLRAVARAQRIYQAMLSRGFDGEIRSAQALKWRGVDSLFLLICGSSFVLAREVDLTQAMGRWLMGHWL